MKRSTLAITALVLALTSIEFQPGGVPGNVSFVKEAHAVVGRPLTPVSAAGVARRTTRRVIYRTTVYVATLPPSCTVIVIEGTTLHQCGGTYYQASGTQYVVVTVD
jgi:hypothetical protein